MPALSGRHTGAVDKMASELQQIIATVSEQSTAAPPTPNPLPNVPPAILVLPFAASNCRAPAPHNARAVGVIDHQPAIVLLRYCRISSSGALSPSMLNTPSVTPVAAPDRGKQAVAPDE